MKNLFYGLLLTLLFTTTPAAAYNSSDLNQLMSSGSCAYGDLSGADLKQPGSYRSRTSPGVI